MLWLPSRLTRKWLGPSPATDGDLPLIAVREVEDRIATIDDLGNPRTVIRTRTLASFKGPSGVVEIEQARRHTLPGFGHVYPVAENEYVVFRDHTRLHADPQIAMSPAVPVTTNVLRPFEPDVEYPKVSTRSMPAPHVQLRERRQTVAVVAGVILVSAAFAVGTLRPRGDPSVSFSAITTTAPPISFVVAPNDDSALPALATPLLHEPQPMASSKEISLVSDKNSAARKSLARVQFAIRPWGVVYLNGKKRGPSPPIRELKLKPGTYTVELRNGAYPPYRETIQVHSHATAKVTHDFIKADTAATQASGPSLASVSRSHTRFLSEEWPR